MKAADIGEMTLEDWTRLAYSSMANDHEIRRVTTVTSLRLLRSQGCPDEALTRAQEIHQDSNIDGEWALDFYADSETEAPAPI